MDSESSLILNLCEEILEKNNSVSEKNKKSKGVVTKSPALLHSREKGITSHDKQQRQSSVLQEQHKGESVSLKQKAGFQSLHSSSLFKSNPEIPSLSVTKQKGLSEPLFSTKTFGDLELHPHLVSCLKSRLEVITMTKVQEKTVPILLQGQDVLVKSCTGSGKTLAYAIPIVQKLQAINPKIKRSDGVFALIVVPTRELALQCYECFSLLTKAFTWIVPGYLIGGEKKKSEKARLRKGINILISTPGRLLDHLEHTKHLSLDYIQWLVIDEADKLLEQGFEESVKNIISQCHTERQTALLSATLSRSVQNLAGMSLSDPVQIDIAASSGDKTEDFLDFSLPHSLKQFVVVVPAKLRLAVMSAFIIENCLKNGFKGLIFMFSQNCVDFHYSLLGSVLVPLLSEKACKCKIFKLHGNMKQEERTEIFSAFKSTKEGVLLCTDVAARGLDLPHVDWIMQYSSPLSAEMYVHRVGRTARIGKKGSSLLFLLPSENKFSHLLSEHKIEFEELDAYRLLESLLLVGDILMRRPKFSAVDCATALQTSFEDEVYSTEDLHESAKCGFISYVQSYASYPTQVRHILPFKSLHLGHIAKSFCLREAPSALGCPVPYSSRPPQRRRRDNMLQKKKVAVPQKRKLAAISEYDSGLHLMLNNSVRKAKKRKH